MQEWIDRLWQAHTWHKRKASKPFDWLLSSFPVHHILPHTLFLHAVPLKHSVNIVLLCVFSIVLAYLLKFWSICRDLGAKRRRRQRGSASTTILIPFHPRFYKYNLLHNWFEPWFQEVNIYYSPPSPHGQSWNEGNDQPPNIDFWGRGVQRVLQKIVWETQWRQKGFRRAFTHFFWIHISVGWTLSKRRTTPTLWPPEQLPISSWQQKATHLQRCDKDCNRLAERVRTKCMLKTSPVILLCPHAAATRIKKHPGASETRLVKERP